MAAHCHKLSHSHHVASLSFRAPWMPLMARYLPEHLRQRNNYSRDLRERVIYLRYAIKFKISQIAFILNMSQRVVERTLQQWRSTGEVGQIGFGRSRKRCRSMDSEEMEVCNSVLALVVSHQVPVPRCATGKESGPLSGRTSRPTHPATWRCCWNINHLGFFEGVWPKSKEGACSLFSADLNQSDVY